MADSLLTLTNLAKINSRDLADVSISDLLQGSPLVAALPAMVASKGDSHKYYKETANSQAAFRAANAGKDYEASTDTEVTVNLKYLDASIKYDRAVANAYIYGPEALLALRAERALRDAFFTIEQQILSGTAADADGFDGFPQSTFMDAASDDMLIDAGGTTALTSIYGVVANRDGANVLVGNGGIIDIGETREEQTLDSSSKAFNSYVVPIEAWVGVTLGGKHSVGRIANIDDGSNKATDDLISSMLEQFPGGQWPSYLVMNPRSARQLQQSRTSTSLTGVAPWPTESQGIPILVSNGLGVAETQVT